jgi:hypothetical protein
MIASALMIGLPTYLPQLRDVDGDAPRLVRRQSTYAIPSKRPRFQCHMEGRLALANQIDPMTLGNMRQRQRCAVARCVMLAVPPPDDPERGPVAKSHAGLRSDALRFRQLHQQQSARPARRHPQRVIRGTVQYEAIALSRGL